MGQRVRRALWPDMRTDIIPLWPFLVVRQRGAAGIDLLVSHKVYISVFVWTLIAVLIALSAGVEVLVTLILIGLLIVRELTDGFLTGETRRRMDLFIYAGLVLFVVVVLRRVWLVLS